MTRIDEERPPARVEELDEIVRWRVEQLLAAGYDGETALLIGLEAAVDLHDALALVAAGCSPETAARILL
jgi:hypothetical protein